MTCRCSSAVRATVFYSGPKNKDVFNHVSKHRQQNKFSTLTVPDSQ